MRPALISYFDLGVSFGLGDRAFDPRAVADPGIVGLVNPFGSGLRVDLAADAPAALSHWRDAAAAQVTRIDTGWSESLGASRATFDAELCRYVTEHGIHRCQMTIYSVGTVYLALELAGGIQEPYVRGLLACFESAAYTSQVSDALFQVAHCHASRAVGGRHHDLAELTRRAAPLVQRDASGYEESQLFSSFTTLLLCVEEGDAARVVDLARAWQLSAADVIDFEYHGRLHFGWAACLVEPRYYPAAAPAGHLATSYEQITRMLRCIQIAHVFLGTCEAFVRLFQEEIQQQVGAHADEAVTGRDPEELNRLRTLALAVVNLTQFNLVAQAEEDRTYFGKFAAVSGMQVHHRLIQDACEILHNVQVAQRQQQEARRQNLLGSVLLLLTSLTLVSVTVDAYSFIRDDQPLITDRLSRAQVLAAFVLTLGLLIGIVMKATRPKRRRRRRPR